METKHKVAIGLVLVIILGGLFLFMNKDSTVETPTPKPDKIEPDEPQEETNYLEIKGDSFSYNIVAGEPFVITNLKDNGAKLWIREYTKDEDGNIDFGKTKVVPIIHEITRDREKFPREHIYAYETTLEEGTYWVKDMWSGHTEIIEVM